MKRDADFRREMLAGSAETLMDDDLELSKVMLRQCVGAVLGFDALGEAIGKPSKSVIHMLSAKGKPTPENLFNILACLQKQEGMNFDPAALYCQRGSRRHEKGDLDGAIADFDEAIRLKPDYAEAWSNRGAAEIAQGGFDAAIADFDEAIRLQPNCKEVIRNRKIALQLQDGEAKNKAMNDKWEKTRQELQKKIQPTTLAPLQGEDRQHFPDMASISG